MHIVTEEEVYAYLKHHQGREFRPETLSEIFKTGRSTVVIRLNKLIKKGVITERAVTPKRRVYSAPDELPRLPAANRENAQWRPLNSSYLASHRRQIQLCRERALA